MDKTISKSYLLISEEEITPIIEKAVSNALSSRNIPLANNITEIIDDYINEEEAKKVLGRKTTWFYNARKSGELKAMKRANKWWYKKSDINDYINGVLM